jgi:peptide/nickel transport system permease protein
MTIAIFVGKRLAGTLALLLVLSLVIYALLLIAPGSPIQTLLGTRPPTPELIAALNAKYHLTDPFFVRYWDWLMGAVHLDFGRSIAVQTDENVTTMIAERLPLTAELAGYALLIVLVVGIPVGLAAGMRQGRGVDRAVSALATFGISAPSFVLSVGLLYFFGVQLGWFPVYGAGAGLTDRIAHLTLPAVALAIFLGAIVVRQTRAAALTVARQDYLTFARIRRLSRRRILLRYVLRNAAPPVVTSTGIVLIAALTAGVFIEQVFSLPGLGSLLLQAVMAKDVTVVQGVAVVLGLIVAMVNLLVDLLGIALDPRTREAS